MYQRKTVIYAFNACFNRDNGITVICEAHNKRALLLRRGNFEVSDVTHYNTIQMKISFIWIIHVSEKEQYKHPYKRP